MTIPFSFLFDTTCINSLAIGTIIYGSYRALHSKLFTEEQEEMLEIRGTTAILYPIIASICLVLTFFFFGSISFVMSISALISSFVGIIFAFFPIFSFLLPSSFSKIIIYKDEDSKISIVELITAIFSITIVISWIVTGNYILNNILGICLSVFFLSILRINTLKIVTLLLLLLFIYDVFWVFYSENIFGQNVMVEVASKKATNPIKIISNSFNIDIPLISDEIELPVKLIFGSMALGLGDIVVPGMLAVLLKKFDDKKNTNYFLIFIFGYLFGMISTVFCLLYFDLAQPALLLVFDFI
eukprot:TRINITY_DN796_c0_g1_i1.p1 TRINITY_DN796_c0_g1~~TRINITY_DN796_c0_g1_i1.p1  ORF type:complete len:299 (+),score=32.14 TRINITY_DN796_c0_g1_i1:69-965(+)